MQLRPYRTADCAELAALFFNTVHTVNAKDYTPAQLDAWADGQVDLAAWDKSFLAHRTLVAEDAAASSAFADMDASGYLDRLYVHRDFSAGARPPRCAARWKPPCPAPGLPMRPSPPGLFSRRGATRVVRSQQVERHGVLLTNFVMEKPPRPPQTDLPRRQDTYYIEII